MSGEDSNTDGANRECTKSLENSSLSVFCLTIKEYCPLKKTAVQCNLFVLFTVQLDNLSPQHDDSTQNMAAYSQKPVKLSTWQVWVEGSKM